MPAREVEKLAEVIRQWNHSRLDLFEISQPDENLEFQGVMRFYYDDGVEGSVATKCLRVGSNCSAREIIETLSEKFRPDMKMLTTGYSLYEIHAKRERKLHLDERPLLVQLNWNSHNREGRFVLKKDKENLQGKCHEKEKGGMIQNFTRTLSRKDKADKNKAKVAVKISFVGNGSSEKPQNNGVRSSDHELQRCTENNQQQRQTAPDNPGLPLWISFSDDSEGAFLSAVINYTSSATVHFRLSPAYILYAAARFALQRHHRRGSTPSGPTHAVTAITNKMVAMTRKVIQRQQTIGGALAFWMANSSELLNFLKQDQDLCLLTQQSQLDLSHLVHRAYSWLLSFLQLELSKHLPTFLVDPEQHGALPAGIEMVLNTLMYAMSLLRRCRVNAALTVQLFSQLFHFISAWLFNQLMSPDATTPGLRSHYWGAALRQRLAAIEAWSERQGLELPVNCHLGHITQATTLLTMNKYSIHDAKDIQTACFRLNSVQLRTLLAGYLYADTEPHIPPELIDAVVTTAEASADNLIRSQGRDVRLEESLDLPLPFLLPEGGYSCDTVTGIPPGLREFLEPMCQKGLCSLTWPSNAKGDWTVFFRAALPWSERTYQAVEREPETVTVTLHKPLSSGMGVSIVAAKGALQADLGIYIKSIVKGGPAETNGGLSPGDMLLSVDGQSLVGLSQERAVAILMHTGPVVTLKVMKSGASYHGLGALLQEPTQETTIDDKMFVKSSGGALALYDAVRTQLHCSNPNMTDRHLEDGDEPAYTSARRNMAAFSCINLCTDTFHREYLTLPGHKSQDQSMSVVSRPQQTAVSLRPADGRSGSQKMFIRSALSQENLYSGGPLLEKRQNTWEQQPFSCFPIRSSVSTHAILSDVTSPKKQRTSGAGVWRAPFSQQLTPTPSTQPTRIDVPVTRAGHTQQPRPALTTFQSPSLKMGLIPNVNRHKQASENHPAERMYARLVPATAERPTFHTVRGQAVKPRVSITPTKHVSFQEPPAQQKQDAGPVKQKDPQAQERSDPWRREGQEKLEEQRGRQAVELLEQEVQELQAKATRSGEENNRLCKLSVELQFRKRLQEVQQRGDDEDEDDGSDVVVMIQQPERQAQNKRITRGNINSEQNELAERTRNNVSQKQEKVNGGQRPSGRTEDIRTMASKKNQEERRESRVSPETLTFKERQRLFSLPSNA